MGFVSSAAGLAVTFSFSSPNCPQAKTQARAQRCSPVSTSDSLDGDVRLHQTLKSSLRESRWASHLSVYAAV